MLAGAKLDWMPRVSGSAGDAVMTPSGMLMTETSEAAVSAGVYARDIGMNPSAAAGPVAASERHGSRWSPYELNGGTSLGIAGDDFAVVAADTRLSEDYSILSRNVSKGKILTDQCVIATGGCYTDIFTLHKTLGMRIDTYRHAHDCDMTVTALAHMLGHVLYNRRFFPYYAFNVVAGVDAEGKGAVYTYDAVGSFERVEYAAQGAGQKLIIPLLDDLIGKKNRTDAKVKLTVEEAVELCKEAFVTAGERDIYTGDAVEIFIIRRGQPVELVRFELKKD